MSTPLAAPVITATLVARMDSAFYSHAVIATSRRHDVRFSITVRMDRAIRRAIAAIDPDTWMAIRYPNATYDEGTGQWISDTEIAETSYTAFASCRTPSGSQCGWSCGG